jgi:hypothetical protein
MKEHSKACFLTINLSESSNISYLETLEFQVSPAVQEGQGALTVLSGREVLEHLYHLSGQACPALGIQGIPSLLSLQEDLRLEEVQITFRRIDG